MQFIQRKTILLCAASQVEVGLLLLLLLLLCENECPDFREEGSIQDLLQSSIDIARGHGRERMERGMRTGADSAS